MTNTLVLPDRYKELEQIDNLVARWENVKLAIRSECRDDAYLEKARMALQANLNDSAINYIWNLTIYDLHKKIFNYGIEYFSSAINWNGKSLRKIEDLREVKEYQLIEGAYALGILPDEAHFFLQQCREIRNNFSTAHYPMGEIDKYETINFIKNCIKYVLTYDLPAPGIQIKDLIDRLSQEKLNKWEEINLIIEQQSRRIHGAILHSLFSKFIKQDCNANLKYNIRLIAPKLWGLVDEEVKSSIASKFRSLKEVQDQSEANEALAFLKEVDGVSYIPQNFLDIIFSRHAKLLIDAHFGVNNFYTEPGYAKDLHSLGYEVPGNAVQIYVKAVVLSFVGNCYGDSRNAQVYNTEMLSNLTQMGIQALFRLLSCDIQVVRELSSSAPATKLKLLMDVIKEKTMLPEQKRLFDYIASNPANSIANYFREKYTTITRVK